MPKIKTGRKAPKSKNVDNFSGLEQLFGSKTRFSLLKLFCKDVDNKYFVRELARMIDSQLNAVRREVANLEAIGIIESVDTDDTKKKFYRLNKDFVLKKEIHSLISGSEVLAEKALIKKISEIGEIDLCIITEGVAKSKAPCDILIVGSVNKNKLANLVASFEFDVGRTVAYAVFTPDEYVQRKALTDRFLFTVLEEKRVIAIDKKNEFTHEDNF